MDASGTRLPTPGAFTGRFQKLMEGAKNWKDVAKRLKGETVTYFDFETTGIPDYDGQNITNDPVQLGAVQVKNGKIVKRFNVYINPESKLSEWSANNLKRDVVDENGDRVLDENGRPESTLVTPDWLEGQMGQEQALRDFIEFIGPGALLGGQNVPFDVEILKRMADKYGIELDIAGTIDSKDLASLLPKYDAEKGIDGPKAPDRKTGEIKATSSLGPVANFLGFEPANWHSADGDAEDSYNLVSRIIERAGSEGSEDLSLLDFPAMEQRYKERMDEFKAVVSPNSPSTEAQRNALQKFAESEKPQVAAKAKDALQTANTRGAAAKALADIHSEDEGKPSERKTGLFNEYSADRLSQAAESDPLTDFGYDPEDEVTIYRGVPAGVTGINPGDWVTDNPQLAKDYAGEGGEVISIKAKAKDLFTDKSSGFEGKGTGFVEEMIYRPAQDDFTGDIMGPLNEEESDPDFDDVDMTGRFTSFEFETNDEESDSDFDDVNLSDVFPAQESEPEPKPEPEPEEPVDEDLTPAGIGKRATILASAVPLFAEMDESDKVNRPNANGILVLNNKKFQGFKDFFSGVAANAGRPLTFQGDRSDRRGRAASKEAKDAKDQIVALGSDVIKQADKRALEDLKKIDGDYRVPEGVTDLDAYLFDLWEKADKAEKDFKRSNTDPYNELTNLYASLLNGLSDKEYKDLVQEAIKKYGLVDVSALTFDDLEIDPDIDRFHNIVVSPRRDSAFLDSVLATRDPRIRMAVEKNRKLNRDMRALLPDDTYFIHPMGRHMQPVIDNAHTIHDVLLLMMLKKNRNGSYDKFLELEQAERKATKARTATSVAQYQITELTQRRHERLAKHLKDFMKEAGVEFDSVEMTETVGAILQYETAQPIDRQTARVLSESWQFYPKNAILKALESSRRTSPLFIQYKTGRAGYSSRQNMFYGSKVDDFLHEQGHWFQNISPTIGRIEHAFLSDRATRDGDALGKIVDSNDAQGTDTLGNEISLSNTGLTDEYTGKLYERPAVGELFSAENQFWETFTTGLEDLFVNFGKFSRGQNQRAVVGSGISKEVIPDPYQDPRTGIWYKDSSKMERIKPRMILGRARKDGMDTELQGLVVGLLLMMNDWNK